MFAIPKLKVIPIFSVIFCALILITLCLQYPFSTTFPIGGDAPYYIQRSQVALTVINDPIAAIRAVRKSWYPLSLVIFSSSAVIPIDWPMRFTWYMTVSHILTGVILSRLLYRISGWRAAALVMVIWAITTTGITTHVEDGTLAQLISFIFLALFLERISAGASWGAAAALVATTLAHPVTGLFLLSCMAIATPILLSTWPRQSPSEKKQIAIVCSISLLVLVSVVFIGKSVFTAAVNINGVMNNPFINILVSRFAPFVALSPLGLLILLKSTKPTTLKFIIGTMFSLAAIMAGNDLLGISVWLDRLAPLFIFIVAMLAAIGLSHIIKSVFLSTTSRATFLLVFIALVSVSAWRSNMNVFEFYENLDNNSRVHPEEIAAMYWIRDNISPDSFIITAINSRHAEWLPALTYKQWLPLSENDSFMSNPTGDNNESPTYHKLKYVAFFKFHQNVPSVFTENPLDYPLIFSNDALDIFNIPPQKDAI
jgi:hypothetical protein